MRVEQRNGSAAPVDFPVAASNGFANASGLADAFLTTFSYAPPDGDDAHPDDYGKARCESRYVVQNGVATLIGRTWRRYTHVTACGHPAVREETPTAAENERHRFLREHCSVFLLLVAAVGAAFALCFVDAGWGVNFVVYALLWSVCAHLALKKLGLAD